MGHKQGLRIGRWTPNELVPRGRVRREPLTQVLFHVVGKLAWLERLRRPGTRVLEQNPCIDALDRSPCQLFVNIEGSRRTGHVCHGSVSSALAGIGNGRAISSGAASIVACR